MNTTMITFVFLLLIACNVQIADDTDPSACIREIADRIDRAQVADTLNLDLDCIEFDKVILLSHEVGHLLLFKETRLSEDAQQKIQNKNYYNWGIAWVRDSVLIDLIEFLPENLILDNLIGGKGYEIIDRAELTPLVVVSTGKMFVGTTDTILDVKRIEKPNQ